MKNIKLLYAGMWLMRKMQFATKLALVTAVLVVPLVIVLAQLVSKQGDEIALTRVELAGVALVTDTDDVIRLLQDHRGQTNLVLSGNADGVAMRDKTRVTLGKATAALQARISSASSDIAAKDWPALRARLQGLAGALEGQSAPDSFALHTTLIEDLNRFVYGLGKDASLLFDPDPATYMLMDMAVSRATPWAEGLAKLRGLGAGVLSQPAQSELSSARLLAAVDGLEAQSRDLKYAVAQMADFGVKDPLAEKALQATADFAQWTRARFAPDSPSGEALAFFSRGTQAIDAVTAYQTSTLHDMKVRLQTRLSHTQRTMWMSVGGASTGVLLMLYFMLAFNMSFLADMRQVLRFMEQTAAGNLRHTARIRGVDEMAAMSTSMEAMVKNMSIMVANVRSNAALVLHAGESLVVGNFALSERTEQQAANLEQTAASVQELSATVDGTVQAAQASDKTASGVRDIAEQGARGMVQAIGSVEAIETSTKRMDEIVGVIDGLAFQTNILALNAAVEAARAGESGRGFAVVATEVRSLAQRSADASQEIRQLIGASSSQVALGVQQIRSAGDNITRIVEGIRDVAAKMSQISSSSAEQSTSLVEIAAAVQQLDKITHQNVAMVEQAVDQAGKLKARAANLGQAVVAFRLQQGTADEARALVERAQAHYERSGSRGEFLRDITHLPDEYHDRDMYVFALDGHGKYLAFGGNPTKVGTQVQAIAGIDGQRLVDDIVAQASKQPGWVEYDIANPVSGVVQSKMSFVCQMGDLYVGCGVYKELSVG